MKGVILAAGKGTRLFPATIPVCKPLVTVYDKPLLYYPLTLLIEAGISDIMIIVPPGSLESFIRLLGDGERLGVYISYKEQRERRGIPDALLLAKRFIGSDSVCLALGDNIFYAKNMEEYLKKARDGEKGATVFGCQVEHPEAFGVLEFDDQGRVLSIEEKPEHPKSRYIVPGLYFYDNSVLDIAAGLRPSERGELEITDVNREYIRQQKLKVIQLDDEVAWIDAGNCDHLLKASVRIREIQQKTGRIIGCVEEASLNQGYITREQVHQAGESMKSSKYGEYLLKL